MATQGETDAPLERKCCGFAYTSQRICFGKIVGGLVFVLLLHFLAFQESVSEEDAAVHFVLRPPSPQHQHQPNHPPGEAPPPHSTLPKEPQTPATPPPETAVRWNHAPDWVRDYDLTNLFGWNCASDEEREARCAQFWEVQEGDDVERTEFTPKPAYTVEELDA